MKKLIVCLSSLQHLIDNAIAVQGERRAELARAMLSRSPQSPLLGAIFTLISPLHHSNISHASL